jgi:hypothetical protein
MSVCKSYPVCTIKAFCIVATDIQLVTLFFCLLQLVPRSVFTAQCEINLEL